VAIVRTASRRPVGRSVGSITAGLYRRAGRSRLMSRREGTSRVLEPVSISSHEYTQRWTPRLRARMAMADRLQLKRVNIYVDRDDLDRVARELGCRPSEAVRRLIDNYLLASEIDEVRRMPGPGPDQVFRGGRDYRLPP